jgi:hypothetical protein
MPLRSCVCWIKARISAWRGVRFFMVVDVND